MSRHRHLDSKAGDTVSRALYEIWTNPDEAGQVHPWKAQLHGYVGHFPSEEAAFMYVQAVKVHRKEIELPKKEVKK